MKNYIRTFYLLLFLIISFSCKNKFNNNKQLLLWCSNNNAEIKFSRAITEKWNQNNSLQVHMQPIPEGQSSEEVILAAVVGKSTPDIYANLWQGNVEMYAHAGVLIPLDTLKGFTEFIHERCDSNIIKEITSSDGHIYQVPWKVNPIMSIYNKDLFAANKITDFPQTYSSYLQAAEKFKYNNKNSPVARRFGYTDVKPIWYQRLYSFYPLYLAASNGAALIQNNKASFNNKYAVGVFRFMQSLYSHDYFSKENTQASTDPFVVQNIATKWTGPWEIAYLNNIPNRNFNFDYYLPSVPDDHSGPVFTYSDPKNIVIFNTCTNPQNAWDFIRTMVDKEGDLQLLYITGELPGRKNLITDKYYSEYFIKNPKMVLFARQIPFVKGVDNCEFIVEVLDIISQEYEACVIYGKKTPEKAIEDAESAVNVLLGQKK